MKTLELLRRRVATGRDVDSADAMGHPSHRQLHGMLRQRGIALRCRSAELANALQRFRDRQAEIDAGLAGGWIQMPEVDSGWLSGTRSRTVTV